jgi:hypothetical protein
LHRTPLRGLRERVTSYICKFRREEEGEGRKNPPERGLVGLNDPDTVCTHFHGRFGEFFDGSPQAGIADEWQNDTKMQGNLCQIDMDRGLGAIEIMQPIEVWGRAGQSTTG